MRSTPVFRRSDTAARPSVRMRSDRPITPSGEPPWPTSTAVPPPFSTSSTHACSAGVHSRRSSKSRWLPTIAGDSATVASAPRPGRARNAAPGANARPAICARWTIARPIGCSDRASSAAATDKHAVGRRAVETQHIGHGDVPVRQRAGLVERDGTDGAEPLEMRAALDQHAVRARRWSARTRSRPASKSRARTDTRRRAAPARDSSRCRTRRSSRRSRRSRAGRQTRAPPRAARRQACTGAQIDRRTSARARAASARAPRGE